MSFGFDEDDFQAATKGAGKYEYFDWYDYDKVKKLNEQKSKQWIKLFVKLKTANEKGDKEALTKAREALRKHEAEGKICKKKAEEAGFYWC